MSELSMSEADDGRTVAGRVGQLIDIRLPENATAGYRWAIERQDKDRLELVAEKAEYPDGTLGSEGVACFTFRLRAPGSAALAMRYGRSWEGADSALKHYRLTVEITDD